MNYKVVLLGDTGVGKSGIVWRLVRDDFYDFQEPTIGSAFTTYNINKIRLDIWDTAGQERYRSLAPMYYRSAKFAIIVYDITNKDSLSGAKYWIKELQTKGPRDIIMTIVGNKVDKESEREITMNEVREYAEENQIMFMETSAKNGVNVKELFAELTKKIPSYEIQSDTIIKIEQTKSNTRSCC
jgi:Ras-related protein Rab-5C